MLVLLPLLVGASSLGLALWGWLAVRQYEQQLARVALAEAELIVRDFADEVEVLVMESMARVLAPLRHMDDWPAGTAVSIRDAAREALSCNCVRLAPPELGTFVWRSTEPTVLESDGVPPELGERLRQRVSRLLADSSRARSDFFFVTSLGGQRAIFAPVLVRVRPGLRSVAGYVGISTAFADSVLVTAMNRVEERRYGSVASGVVSWRGHSALGDLRLERGDPNPAFPGASGEFLRSRFRVQPSVPPPESVRQESLPPRPAGPTPNIYTIEAYVDPTALGAVLYGSTSLLQSLIAILFAISVALTVLVAVVSRRLVRQARERAAFTTAVAHDLRTPLTQILLYGESLLLDRPAVFAQRQAAHVIVRETRRLVRLVEDALRQVRGGRSQPSMDIGPLSLLDAVNETVAALAPSLQRSGCRVTVAIHPDPIVMADSTALVRVITNLLDNAMRFGAPAQEIRLSLLEEPGTFVSLAVDDEGPGIPKEVTSALRAHGAVNTSLAGTGIGLTVSQQLVERMGGGLTVATAPAGGARVIVRLRTLDDENPRT